MSNIQIPHQNATIPSTMIENISWEEIPSRKQELTLIQFYALINDSCARQWGCAKKQLIREYRIQEQEFWRTWKALARLEIYRPRNGLEFTEEERDRHTKRVIEVIAQDQLDRFMFLIRNSHDKNEILNLNTL